MHDLSEDRKLMRMTRSCKWLAHNYHVRTSSRTISIHSLDLIRGYSDLDYGQGSDYLLCQLTANKTLSTLESLPAEILEPILDEVHLNSISGLRALAAASRTCRALASPYFFKPLECEFNELEPNHGPENIPVVILSAVDNFKALNIHREPNPRRRKRVNITQVLNVENTFECFEYLPFRLPPSALDLLSRTLPLLSRLVINLEDFNGYSPSWDQAYARAKMKRERHLYAPLSHRDGLDSVCAIARFEHLRHLTLHFQLREDQIVLMHPNPGCQAVLEVLESIRRRQESQKLVRLEVVFCTAWYSMHPLCYSPLVTKTYSPTVSTTMTAVCSMGTISKTSNKPQCHCTCNNTQYGKVIERRKRFEKLGGEPDWRRRRENLSIGRCPSLLWIIFEESLTRLALLPSYFFFEDGKRVRFKPSLADVEVRCYDPNWMRRDTAHG